MTRRLEATIGTLAALLLCGSAYLAIMNTLGEWLAHRKWASGFSATYPDLFEWSFGGARTAAYTANPLLTWVVVSLWSVATWRAACLKKDEFRLPWMLAAMGGLIACVGFGDMDMVPALFTGIVGACALVKGPVKPLLFAIFLSLTGVLGTILAWDTSLANPPPSLWVHYRGGVFAALVAMAIVALILRRIPMNRAAHGVWASALIAACAYVGIGNSNFSSAWSARTHATGVLASSPAECRLKDILNRYRLGEWEASMQRYPDATSSTRWRLLPEVLADSNHANTPLIAAWLKADAALFSKKTPFEKIRMRDEALREIDRLDFTNRHVASVARELEGWLRHDAGDIAASEKAFLSALTAHPENSQAWCGISLVFAESGRLQESAKAYAIFTLLEPRAIFSPALTHGPFAKVESEAYRIFIKDSSELSGFVSSSESARWKRYAEWKAAWTRARGDAQKFLADTNSPRPVSEAVECARKRIGEILRKPDEKRAVAIISSSVAILANRHLNIGQALEIHHALSPSQPLAFITPSEVMRTAPLSIKVFEFPPTPQPTASFKTRPEMIGWHDASSIDAGGSGACLAYFEENMIIRLLTYGQEDASIRLPESWLRTNLMEISASKESHRSNNPS